METTDAPVVELTGLTKAYGGTTVVDNVSLHVQRGEIFGIVGTNGAGKTTSVECAQGLRRPDHGTVRVLGHDPISDRSALAGRVGSQLQDSNLPERLRVVEAVRLFAQSSQQASETMAEWQLDEIANVPFGGLSGGQRQRLFLAMALLNNPEIVFLDELTQGLDPDARRTVWRLIERVRAEGTTVVLVTHFMEEAEVLCDRVAVMKRGQVVAEGTVDELIDRFGRGLRVRFPGTSNDVEWLRRIDGVSTVRVVGAEVEAVGSPTIAADVGHALVCSGRAPIALRVHQPDLEDALLALTTTPDNKPTNTAKDAT